MKIDQSDLKDILRNEILDEVISVLKKEFEDIEFVLSAVEDMKRGIDLRKALRS